MLNSSQCLPFKFNFRKVSLLFHFVSSKIGIRKCDWDNSPTSAVQSLTKIYNELFSRMFFSFYFFFTFTNIFLYKNKQQFLFVKFYEPNFVNTEASSRWKQYFFLIGKWRKKQSNFRASSKICIFIKGQIIVSVNDSLRVEWIWKKMLENIKTE